MGADPDGRFALVLHGSPRAVTKVDTDDGGLTPVFDSTEIPHVEQADMLYPMQHQTLGRIWIIEGGGEKTLLFDAANDGHFETFETMDLDTFQQDYAFEYDYPAGVWLDNFLSRE